MITFKPYKPKPPLGLMPVKLHRELRMLNILSAMTRYISVSKKIPLEWINELDAINERIY